MFQYLVEDQLSVNAMVVKFYAHWVVLGVVFWVWCLGLHILHIFTVCYESDF